MKAVSLEYDGETAPVITAMGDHDIAEKILEIARQFDVPIYQNSELVELLARLEIGDQIPQELYLVIAQIIAFVYHLKGKTPKSSTT